MDKLQVKISAFNKIPLIGIVSDGGAKNCRFSQILGDAANDLIDYGNFNCTVVRSSDQEGYGSYNETSGMYNGMYGSMQANKSDFGLAVGMVPLEVDAFKYGPVLASSRITTTSVYRMHNSTADMDLSVSDSLNDVSSRVWLCYALFLLIFWWMLVLGKCLLKRSNHISSYWTIFTFVCNEETFEVPGFFFSLFSLLITLMTFFSREYFNSIMKTELVQPSFPTVINSFGDILRLKYHPVHGLVDRHSVQGRDTRSEELKPMFNREMRTVQLMKFASKGSIQRSVYEHSLKVHGSHKNMLVSFIVRDDSSTYKLLKGNHVLIETEPISRLIRVVLCTFIADERIFSLNSDLAHSSVWFGKNASIYYLLGYTYSESIAPDVRERLDKIIYRFGESGLVHVLWDKMSTSFLPIRARMRSCLRDNMDIEITKAEFLEFKHITSIILWASWMFQAACLMIVLELMRFQFEPFLWYIFRSKRISPRNK